MMDVPDVQKTKPKTVMSRIGQLTSVENFSSLCINIDTLVSGTVTTPVGRPTPIIRQIMIEFVKMVNGWKHWMDIAGAEMPLLHVTLYVYLESAWIGLATFATDFNNANVISKSRPLTNLHLQGLQSAIRSFKAFRDSFLNAQASNAVITSVPHHLRLAIVPSESTNTSNGINRGRNGDAGSSPPNGRRNSSGNSNQNKCNTSGNGDQQSAQSNNNHQACSNKSARRGGDQVDTAPPTNTERWMFYLKDASINPAGILPPNLTPHICPLFTCKGKECNKTPEECGSAC